jgi:exopolysaccharide biosynthesis polyprenyl glycosylphosphotransferase
MHSESPVDPGAVAVGPGDVTSSPRALVPAPGMIRRHGKLLRGLLMAVDATTAAILGLAVYQLVVHPNVPLAQFLDDFWLRTSLYALLWVGLLYINGAYRLRAYWTLAGEARAVVRAAFWLAALGMAALLVFASDAAERGYVLLLFPLQGLATIALRGMLRGLFMVVRRAGFNSRNLVILGSADSATAFAQLVHAHSALGVKVVGFLGDRRPAGVPEGMYWGPLHELPRVLRDEVVDEIAICVRPTEWRLVEEYARMAHQEGVLVRVPLLAPHLDSSRRHLEDLEGTAVLSFSSGADELAGQALKRAFDIAVASAAIVVLGPLMLGVAILLRIRQGPDVLFRQTRVGIHGRPFTIYKFRTMTLDAEDRYAELAARSHTRGAAFKMVGDPRITDSGRWLRRFSLDELPQFLNVLKGEMSVVGPRPAPPREVEAYDLWHRRRLSVKPGITGLWQVTARLDSDFDDRAVLDLSYIDRWSIWLDLSILFRTLPAVLRRPGQ